MKIYTKTGDKGETGLIGGSRVPKDHLRIEVYGTLDELNSHLGLVLCGLADQSPLYSPLHKIQRSVFDLGSELATPPNGKLAGTLLGSAEILALEQEIDQFETQLEPLKHFILPGGCRTASHLHLSRTVCRRAERAAVHLHHLEPLRAEVLNYLNRLSDFLFVSARLANHLEGVAEEKWH
ncbi:cob(I)yrinic acid a,c-diamide adenosyltransferase [Bdellovibrionota bacterium FG-2]